MSRYEGVDFYNIEQHLTEEETMVRDLVREWVDEKLQDITNLQVLEYFSMVLLNAACAAPVSASASSKNIILNPSSPRGAVLANSLILPLTTSIPLSSEAFNS